MAQLPTAPTTGRPCGKVPQLIQMEALECGATSLGMVCAYYGLWVSPEKLRADCGVSRDGAKALNIVKAARSYGFDAAGYRIEPALLQREGEFPCIIHWGFNHFVVLRGFKNGRALINDPARGEVEVSPEEFDEQFTGIVIKLAPNASFKPGGHKPSIWGFVRKRSLGTADGLLFVALATAIVGLLGLVPPLLAQTFTDKLIGSTDTALRVLFFAVLIALCVLQVAASALNSLYTLRTEGKLCTVGSASYMWHLMHLPMEFFGQRSAGDLINRLGLNKSVANTVLTQLAPIFINCASALVCLGIMAYYSAPLAAAGLVASAAKVIAAKVIADKRTNFVRVAMRDKAKLSGVTVAGIQTIETLKATGAVNGFMRRWTGYQASASAQSVEYARLNATWGLIPQVIGALLDAFVLVAGLWLILRGQFTVGMVLAFQGMLIQFSAPLESLIQSMQTLQETTADMERIEDVMNYPLDPLATEDAPCGECEKLKGSVKLEKVSFGYSRLATPLIKDFDLEVRPGGCIALVGPSGCGKSTVAKLVTGLYQPWEGQVLLDGTPLPQIPRTVRCGSITTVDQEIVLFKDSVANNLTLMDDSIPDEAIVRAARDARIYDAIMERMGGFNHVLQEGGADFSGGQCQRLEIARALAAEPSILVLDEATSALDAQTELEVMRAVRERGTTVIMVTHRLSAIRDCDEIIVLDKGQVVQRGTHEQLMAQGGLYTQLVAQE